jgi:hypothetical protein
MTIAIIVAFVLIALAILSRIVKGAEDARDDFTKKEYTETICGNCGGPECSTGCDKPSTGDFPKPEKERFVTVDEIRHTAYLIAAGDNFQKSPSHYWCEAEKQLKEQI